jgi:DNA-binding beta-propeller fold protein YncE
MFVRGVWKASVCALALSAFAVAPAAEATVGHRFSGQFAGGQLAGPSGVAIDQTTGSVFVADQNNGLIQKFNATGDFLANWSGSATPASAFFAPAQVATDAAGMSVYVADQFNNAVDRFDGSGVYQDQLDPAATNATVFNDPQGVAVDPANGDVYVADTGNGVVERFDASGVYQDEFGAGELSGPTSLAVDSSHDVYVLDSGNARVVEYIGEVLSVTIDNDSPTAVAVDPTTSHLYVGEADPAGYRVTEYASDNTRLSSFGSGHIGSSAGIAVNAAANRVYVADQQNSVVATFNAVTLPTVSTTPGATEVDANDATVAGTVNPEGVAGTTTYRFDYGLDTNYGASTPDTDTGGGSADVPAGATLTGLTPGTTYHFRVVASNSQGSITGADETFTTSAGQVAVDVQPPFASVLTTTTATLNGTLNPNGADVTYHFEYGPTTGYGTSTPDADGGAATGEAPVMQPVTGLQPGTIYHFRLVADNGVGGTVQGADATFVTASGTAPSASNVTSNSAVLNAVLPPTPLMSGSYHFEYGTDTGYGTSTSETSFVSQPAASPVVGNVVGLAPGTEYHFRLVATIIGQTVSSDDATFTTVPAPAVVTSPVTGLAPTAVTLNASADTHGFVGTVTFAVTSPDSPYAVTTSAGSLAASNGPQTASVSLAGLPPSADYVVRASATVAGTTTWGSQVAFSTPSLPPFAPPPPSPPTFTNPYGCAEPLTVDCAVSNTIGLAGPPAPSNAFTVTGVLVKGSTATVSVKVPGPGSLRAAATNVSPTQKTIGRASTAKLTVHLNKAGRRALAKTHNKKLAVALRVTFTPAGGRAASQVRTVTFRRGGTR